MINPVLKPKGNNYLVSEYQTAGQIAGAIVKQLKRVSLQPNIGVNFLKLVIQ